MSDIPTDPALAAVDAAAAADRAADAAQDAAIAAAAVPPQPNPADIIAADVAIAQEQEATERARIEARTAVKIAELQNEEPAWLNDLRACLTRLEMGMAALLEAGTSQQSSTPAPSAETTVIVEPKAPVITEQAGAIAEAPAAESGEVTLESNAVQDQNNPPAPARPRRRWI